MDQAQHASLLEESIKASNRTTHAVRALTTFIVYEAVYALGSGVCLIIGFIPVFALEEPWWFFILIAAGLAIGGLFHSFSVAFRELSESVVRPFRLPPAKIVSEPSPSSRPATSPKKGDQSPQMLSGECDCTPGAQREVGGYWMGDKFVCGVCNRAIDI